MDYGDGCTTLWVYEKPLHTLKGELYSSSQCSYLKYMLRFVQKIENKVIFKLVLGEWRKGIRKDKITIISEKKGKKRNTEKH